MRTTCYLNFNSRSLISNVVIKYTYTLLSKAQSLWTIIIVIIRVWHQMKLRRMKSNKSLRETSERTNTAHTTVWRHTKSRFCALISSSHQHSWKQNKKVSTRKLLRLLSLKIAHGYGWGVNVKVSDRPKHQVYSICEWDTMLDTKRINAAAED